MEIVRYYSQLLVKGRVNNPSLTEARRDLERAYRTMVQTGMNG